MVSVVCVSKSGERLSDYPWLGLEYPKFCSYGFFKQVIERGQVLGTLGCVHLQHKLYVVHTIAQDICIPTEIVIGKIDRDMIGVTSHSSRVPCPSKAVHLGSKRAERWMGWSHRRRMSTQK